MHDCLALLLWVYLVMLLHQLVRGYVLRVQVIRLVNALAVRLQRISHHVVSLKVFTCHVASTLSLIDIDATSTFADLFVPRLT